MPAEYGYTSNLTQNSADYLHTRKILTGELTPDPFTSRPNAPGTPPRINPAFNDSFVDSYYNRPPRPPATASPTIPNTAGVLPSSTTAHNIAGAVGATAGQARQAVAAHAQTAAQTIARNPRQIAQHLPIVASGTVGVLTATTARQSGADWATAVGRGIGAAVGAHAGAQLGAVGGAAISANPWVAAAGGVGGGMLGQSIGGAVGGSLASAPGKMLGGQVGLAAIPGTSIPVPVPRGMGLTLPSIPIPGITKPPPFAEYPGDLDPDSAFPLGRLDSGDGSSPTIPVVTGATNNALYELTWTATLWSGFPRTPQPPSTTKTSMYGPVTQQSTGRVYDYPDTYPGRYSDSIVFTHRLAPDGPFVSSVRVKESTDNYGDFMVSNGSGSLSRLTPGDDDQSNVPPPDPSSIPAPRPRSAGGANPPSPLAGIGPRFPGTIPPPMPVIPIALVPPPPPDPSLSPAPQVPPGIDPGYLEPDSDAPGMPPNATPENVPNPTPSAGGAPAAGTGSTASVDPSLIPASVPGNEKAVDEIRGVKIDPNTGLAYGPNDEGIPYRSGPSSIVYPPRKATVKTPDDFKTEDELRREAEREKWNNLPLQLATGVAVIAVGAGIGIEQITKPKTVPSTVPPKTPIPPQPPVDSPCRCNIPIMAKLDGLEKKLGVNNLVPAAGDGTILAKLEAMQKFAEKAWETTRIQKILDVLTFVGVMHNVSMLSRDVGETFFQLVGQGLQAAGVRDEEGSVIDVGSVVGNSVETFIKSIVGEAVYNGVSDTWNKANRIVSSASSIIWTVRSIADSSLDLMEWIGENTGRIGNALKRWGVVGERSYPWMSESAKAQSRFRNRFSKATDALENAEDRLSVYMQAISAVIEVQEETAELGESWQRFRQSVEEGLPDPWSDNTPIKQGYDANKAISNGPDVPPSEAQKG